LAGVDFPKGSAEWAMMAEFWVLCKKYWKPEKSDEYWESLKNELDGFWKKQQGENSVFARGLADVLNRFLAGRIESGGS